jgi:glutathione S-transferase
MYTPHLIAISVSHYCEKVRWALRWHGMAYTQENHCPIFHITANLRQSGQTMVPVLLTQQGPIKDSTEILRWIDAQPSQAPSLYPEGKAQEALDWEERFDEQLGPHTRRWPYFYLLQQPELTIPLLQNGIPRHEARLLPLMFPLAKVLMSRSLKITPDSVERSRQKIDALLQEVGQVLKDGRPFLIGETFSAADLTFASLAAPVLCPPEYSVPFYTPEQAPLAMGDQIQAWRTTPAGQHALRCFQSHYRPGWQVANPV